VIKAIRVKQRRLLDLQREKSSRSITCFNRACSYEFRFNCQCEFQIHRLQNWC